MKRSTSLFAASAVFVLAGANSAKAELIYGFENTGDPTSTGVGNSPDGFVNQDANAFGQSTLGATQGAYSGDITASSFAGYNQADITTPNNPVDLEAASTATFSALVSSADNYVTIAPIEYLEGPPGSGKEKRLAGTSTSIVADTTLTPVNTLSLLFTDPDYHASGVNSDGDSGMHSAATIAAADSAFEGITYAAGNFQLQFLVGGLADGSDPTTTDIYIDNFQVPSAAVPEPASLGLLAAGGVLLVRRRRAR